MNVRNAPLPFYLTLATILSEVPLCCAGNVGGQGDALARFLSEAPPAWKAYRDAMKQFAGSYTTVTNVSTGYQERVEVEFKRNASCEMVIIRQTKKLPKDNQPSYEENLYAYNPSYAFVLNRIRKNSPWALTQVVDLAQEEMPRSISRTFYYNEKAVCFLIWMEEQPLSEWLHNGIFELTGCDTVKSGTDQLLKLRFRRRADAPEEKFRAVVGGSMILDPQAQWTLRGYDLRLQNENLRGSLTLRCRKNKQTSNNLLIPVELVVESKVAINNGQTVHRVSTGTYKLMPVRRVPPDSDFTLTAFGFPEYVGQPTQSHWPLFIWSSIIGAVVLLLAVLAFRLGRRRGLI